MRSLGYLLSVSLLLLIGTSPLVSAEETATTGDAKAPAAKPVPEALATPRATMRSFIGAMQAFVDKEREDIEPAIAALNLSEINAVVRDEAGADRAWMLWEILERAKPVRLTRIPDKEDTPSPYRWHDYPEGAIELAKQEDGRWLFSAKTVASLPKILDGLTQAEQQPGLQLDSVIAENSSVPLHIRLRTKLPEQWRQKVLFVENWQWAAGLLFVLLGVVVDKLTALLLKGLVVLWNNSRYWCNYEPLAKDILRPFGLMAMAGVWTYGINQLGLPPEYRLILSVAATFLASFAAVWGAYRLVDLVRAILQIQALKSASKLDDALVPLLSRALKILVTVGGFLFIAANLNFNVTGLIAGLGLGGLAFALAAKDMVQNLFGSITVLTDKTFMVGDWIKVGDVEGTVEDIGFRSTRIRTFHNSLLTVPNTQFITSHVDNLGKRIYRRYKTVIGITYDTPTDKIDAFCTGMRKIVLEHPRMKHDGFYVHLNDFAESSLNILVYVFFQVQDWSQELQARESFILQTIELAERLGVEFAFPSRTIYLKEDIAHKAD